MGRQSIHSDGRKDQADSKRGGYYRGGGVYPVIVHRFIPENTIRFQILELKEVWFFL